VTRVYYDSDADLGVLQNKTLAVIGYGNQGRAQALNMRDSGLNVVVGNRRDDYWNLATRDGFKVLSIAEAAEIADVICMLIPDDVQPPVYDQFIKTYLGRGKTLDFASGYNLYFSHILPPEEADVVMVAPKMIGQSVRDLYVKGSGGPALVGVQRNASGWAHQTALAIAKAIGATRVGAIESSVEEETITDLFAEQTLDGPFLLSMQTAFDVLVDAGYNPEVVLLELYSSGEVIEVLKDIVTAGLYRQLDNHSTTSQYGQLTRAPMIVSQNTKTIYQQILDDIKNGKFSEEWELEREAGYSKLTQLKKAALAHRINAAEDRIKRKMRLSWLSETGEGGSSSE